MSETAAEAISRLTKERDEAIARATAAEAALRAMAQHYDWFIDDPSIGDSASPDQGCTVTIGELRAARTLTPKQEPKS
jgi:hypothetical protein